MGCKESKLAVGSADPAKRTKSASSRSTSTRVERLDSTTVLDNEKAPLDAASKDVAKGGGPRLIKKAVESKDHCPKESDHAKATAEEEETKCKEGMKEVGKCEEQEHVKIEEEEAQNANDQAQTTKEDSEEGKPNEAKVEAEVVVKQEQNANDEVEVVEKQEQNAKVEDEVVENQEQQVIQPIEVESDPAIEEETDKTVSNNEDDQPQATEQEEAAHKVETIVVAEAPSVSEEEPKWRQQRSMPTSEASVMDK